MAALSLNLFSFDTRTGRETSSEEAGDAVRFRIRCGSLCSDARYADPTDHQDRRVGLRGCMEWDFDMVITALDPATRKRVVIAEGTDRARVISIRRSDLGSEFEFVRAITPHVNGTTPEIWRAKMMNELMSVARGCSLDPTINHCEVFMRTLTLKKRRDREHDEDLELLASGIKGDLPSSAVSEPATLSSVNALKTAAEEELDADDCCPICTQGYGSLSSSQTVVIMPCSHKYHRDCITQWLLVNHVCPMCRFKMPHEVIYHDPGVCSGLPFPFGEL